MKINNLLEKLALGLFAIAAVAIPLAFVELAVQAAGKSLIGGMYTPGRIIELAALLLVFVIAVLLMQIRDELRAGRAG